METITPTVEHIDSFYNYRELRLRLTIGDIKNLIAALSVCISILPTDDDIMLRVRLIEELNEYKRGMLLE